ncbi:cupin domain-containing protein [Pantoea sp. RRHST58]|uniref:cupin domain-containing protein n=1 Tax=Pantoea sp. RRHST58 TaxID=3425183 RepID=UPI003D9FF2F6
MITSLFDAIPQAAERGEQETFEALLRRPGLCIERIVSTGQASPPGFWYSQPQGEWVLVVQGAAGLQLEDEAQERVLRAGDFINLPARTRHRVNWTSSDEPTLWLAVHYELPPEEEG